MLNRKLNQVMKCRDCHCTIVCTEFTHVSPNNMILCAQPGSILLKIRTPQNATRTSNQRVGSSNLSGRATLITAPHWVYAASTESICTTFCSPSSPSKEKPNPARSHHSRRHASSFCNPIA